MCKISFKNDLVYVLQLLQYSSVYPSRHPPGHLPLTWLQGLLFLQWLLQRSLQSNPKYLGVHSIFKKTQHISAIPINYSLRNIFIIALINYSDRRDIIKQQKCILCFCIYKYTCATVVVCVSRITSPVTLTRQFVTRKTMTTVTTTVLVTTITIGPVITFCNRLYLNEIY